MSAQDLINAWGRKKWPEHAEAVFRIETVNLGPGCDTCGYGGGITLEVTANHKTVAEMEADFATVLNEIIGAAA